MRLPFMKICVLYRTGVQSAVRHRRRRDRKALAAVGKGHLQNVCARLRIMHAGGKRCTDLFCGKAVLE